MNNIVKRTNLIGLLGFTGPPLPVPESERRTLDIGDVLFVMRTDEVAAVRELLQQCGARVQAAPHAFEVRGADDSLLRMTTLSCWDPDGYLFELNQRHPS